MHTNLDRIINDIETLATYTSTPGKGVTRSSYSKEDQMAKDYLKKEMEKIGLDVYEDAFATVFGQREGKNPDAPTIIIGSHYDSVVNGGRFDGTAGVIAALETLRVLEENHIENDYPIEIIAMNAEEGETFGPGSGVSNSRAMVGTLTEKELDMATNRFGETKREAMKNYGLEPDLEAAKREMSQVKSFLELHIEQGPNLEAQQTDIGLVEYLAGIGRYMIRFHGKFEDSTAAMDTRQDALIAASKFILALDELVKGLGDGITGTVGMINVTPNSNQYVPEFAEISVEIRTMDKAILDKVDVLEELKKIVETIEMDTNVKVEITERARIGYPNPTPPSVMDKETVKLMEEVCEQLNYSSMIINKGTGHDAMITAEYVPTNMIYVPSKDGISHHPDEWTDYEDLQKGIEVMLHTVKKLCQQD
ncbi:Zn-dependent hydrolase [Gracilibacillus timonensis]|uniref:Zn-dependent hydrolase n=1 Tax=Gracilibacillus timonensis TaxID=1816696 RepID=UPI000825EE29|nr:Zn-dependent hydrolase [Gracilibacillus timonensis]